MWKVCPHQQSGALRWSPRASSAMRRHKHTPRSMTHTCKPQGKTFHWTTDTGHKKGHVLDPTSPQIWGAVTWTMPKHLSATRNHSPECLSLLFCHPFKRQKMQDKSSSTCFCSAKQRIVHHQFSPCRGTKLLPGDVPPRGKGEGVLATGRGKPGGGVQPASSSTPHQRSRGSVSPTVQCMAKCSPGRKERSAPKTNTKLEYFLLYFSYRSSTIQKRIEERAIIKPLMYY